MRVLLLSIPLLLFSCRNDFTLQAELQDVPVVYGFLDAGESTHYLRVERALAEGGITDPGQLYYAADAATVSLTNVGTGVTAELERVDGDALGLPRAAGPFPTAPNILYRVDDAELRLQPGQTVEVRVARPSSPDALARTELLEPVRILRPTTTVRLDDYRRPLIVSWNAPPQATLFAVQFLFEVKESYAGDPTRDRTLNLTYNVNPAYQPTGDARTGDVVTLEVDNPSVYRFLGESLPAGADVNRQLMGFDLRVTAVGPELTTLITLADANAGLTGAQPRPRYSNVNNGEGVVSSRSSDLRMGIQFDSGSLDSLREGRYTKLLNFR